MQNQNASNVSVLSQSRDDIYNTRQHAFNIGLAFATVSTSIILCSTIIFGLPVIWLLRGALISFMLGVLAFAKSLIDFTNEARDIQWEQSMPKVEVKPIEVDHQPHGARASFPSPQNPHGLLFTTVGLNENQRRNIAEAAIQHGKLTVNYLTSLGLRRDDAERLREELVSHNLLMFNDRHETVVTKSGRKSFIKLLK
jgi:hypothetical protein